MLKFSLWVQITVTFQWFKGESKLKVIIIIVSDVVILTWINNRYYNNISSLKDLHGLRNLANLKVSIADFILNLPLPCSWLTINVFSVGLIIVTLRNGMSKFLHLFQPIIDGPAFNSFLFTVMLLNYSWKKEIDCQPKN